MGGEEGVDERAKPVNGAVALVGSTSASLKIKVRRQVAKGLKGAGKPVTIIDFKNVPQGRREQIFVRTRSSALQVVTINGVVVHIDCKAPGCGNEWVKEYGEPVETKFKVNELSRPLIATCLKCGRVYPAA